MVVTLTTFFIYALFSIFFIPLPSKKHPIVFYSNQTRFCLKNMFIQAIKTAQQQLTVHTFALTDSGTLQQLIKKSQQGIHLEIVSDYRNLPAIYPLFQQELNWSGIKTSGLMHQKVLLVDDTLSFLGTANMTYESMKMHDNLVLGFYSRELNTFLQEYTKKIPLRRSKKNSDHAFFSINGQALELWMLPFKGNKPLGRLLELIRSAKTSIDISMFTLTHPTLLTALKEASQQGVEINLYIDKTSAQGASFKALQSLEGSSIHLHLSQGIQLLHHKMMVIDNTHFILGSANWTKSAFEKNHDFYLVLSPLTKPQLDRMQSVFKAIKKESQ